MKFEELKIAKTKTSNGSKWEAGDGLLCASCAGAGCQNKQSQPGQGGGSGLVACAFVKVFLKKFLSSCEKIWLYRVRTGVLLARQCDEDDAEGEPASLNTSHAPLLALPPASRISQAPEKVGSCPVLWVPTRWLLSVNSSHSVLNSRLAFQVQNTDFGVHFTVLSSCLLAHGIDVIYTWRREEKTLESIDSSKSCCRLLIDHKLPLSYVYKTQRCCFPLMQVL